MKLHHTLLATAALLASLATQAQTIAVSPSHTDVALGASFAVDLDATGFPNKIFGGGYNVAFDPAILKLDSITFPSIWEFSTSPGTLDASAGTVTDVNFNTFSAPVQGNFLTATLHFTNIGHGTSPINVTASGSFPFGDEFGNAVNVTFVNGSVTSVPEPASLAMVFGGLTTLGWMTSRRRRHQA